MRALKALVIVMGVIIVVGVAVVGITIFNRLSKPAPLIAPVVAPVTVPPSAAIPSTVTAPGAMAPNAVNVPLGVPLGTSPGSFPGTPPGTPTPQPVERKFGDVSVAIPSGARLADFSAAGDRAVLRVVLPNQDQQLMVIDLLTGTLLGTIKLVAGATNGPGGAAIPTNGGGIGLLMPLPQVNVPPRNKSEGLK